MAAPKLFILLCCTTYYGLASKHSHTIPIEGYETELQNLGEHVEIPETPVRLIKITKTVAVKIPVPYPVKIVEKVPYPVHIAKPYPVHVPQIVHVPQVAPPKGLHENDAQGGHGSFQNTNQRASHEDYPNNAYDLSSHGDTDGPASQSYHGGNSGHGQSVESLAGDGDYLQGGPESYEAPSSGYYGNSGHGDDSHSFESRSYDQAMNDYLQKSQ